LLLNQLFISLEPTGTAKSYVGGPVGLEDLKHLIPHLLDPLLLGRHVNQIMHLPGISFQIIHLVGIPHPAAVNIFISVPANGVSRRSMRKSVLPKILMDKGLPPVIDLFASQQRQK